jgi:hypothetical protein
VADWALWAEAVDGDDAEPVGDAEPAEVDDSLEARRLSRWLRAMFGGSKEQPDDSES